MTRETAGRLLLTVIAIFGGVGGVGDVFADWSPTHTLNPNWPPHAKFHNGQTLATGALLAVFALFFLWRRAGDRATNAIAATLFAGTCFWTQAAANFFPGAAWKDPEFLNSGETLDQFPPPQLVMNVVVTAAVLLGFWLLRPRRTASDQLAGPPSPL